MVGPKHFHDIETKQNVRIIEQTKPGQGTFGNAHLLLSIDGFERAAELLVPARLHFHENQSVRVATNKVDLSTPAIFEISIENFVAVAS